MQRVTWARRVEVVNVKAPGKHLWQVDLKQPIITVVKRCEDEEDLDTSCGDQELSLSGLIICSRASGKDTAADFFTFPHIPSLLVPYLSSHLCHFSSEITHF